MNSPELACPLCGFAQTRWVERIDSRDVAWLYRRAFRLDVTQEFENVAELGFHHCPNCDLHFFNPPVTGSDNFYNQLQRLDFYYLACKSEFEYARRFIGPEDKVLEIGCGSGAFGEMLRVKSYLGLELSPEAARIAANKGLEITMQSVEAHALLHPEHYDVVCAFQVLEHVARPAQFIRAALGCLRRGGRLILSVPNSNSVASVGANNLLNMPPHHTTWWSPVTFKIVGEVFDLRLIALERETLAAEHRQEYIAKLFLESVRRRFRWRPKLIDRSLTHRFLAVAAHGLSWLACGLADPRLAPTGHALTVVYDRP
jgi:2-polyprenyl-3-methyl-5-hydroxy-6-metoxy-1,4-benzoquinol methylase